MNEKSSVSLFNLNIGGKLTKPAGTLLKMILRTFEKEREPHRIVAKAEAQAKAEIINLKSQLDQEITLRAYERLMKEETIKQSNMESIVEKSFLHLEQDADASYIEDDWMRYFLDKCSLTSHQDLQQIWARVLAQEANKAGSSSKRLLSFLAVISKEEANAFEQLINFSCNIFHDNKIYNIPLIYDFNSSIYIDNNLDFNKLLLLESIGLLHVKQTNNGFGDDYYFLDAVKDITISYFKEKADLIAYFKIGNVEKIYENAKNGITDKDLGYDYHSKFNLGRVQLTPMGKELSGICSPIKNEGYFDYIKSVWIKNGCKIADVEKL